MKIFVQTLIFILTFSINSIFAQQGEWTWMHGDSTGGSAGRSPPTSCTTLPFIRSIDGISIVTS